MRAVIAGLIVVCSMTCCADTAVARQDWIVEFRLSSWRTMHFPNADKANQHIQAMRKLGCETKKFDHNGHFDVRYRCTNWKQMKLATDDEAHQWVRWLKQNGFETVHQH